MTTYLIGAALTAAVVFAWGCVEESQLQQPMWRYPLVAGVLVGLFWPVVVVWLFLVLVAAAVSWLIYGGSR